MTLGSRLEKSAGENAGRPALIYGGRKITYSELDGRAAAFARALRSLGFSKGDRAAIMLPNCPEFPAAYFGIAKAGGAAVPVNTFLAPPEVEYILRDSGARCLVVSKSFHERLAKILPAIETLEHVIITDGEADDALSFEGLVSHAPRDISLDAPSGDDIAAILYTSGTTGSPKGAALTHDNLLSNADSVSRAFEVTRKDRFLLFLPMFHSFSFLVCMILPLSVGGSVIVMTSVKPFAKVIKAIVFGRASFFVAIPPVYNLLSARRFPRWIFKLLKLRLCVSGAAPLSAETLERFAINYPIPLLEGYGLTEASPVVACNPLHGRRKPGSVGIAIPGVEVKVVDEHGLEMPRGQVGEITVKGPNVMKGYWGREEATRETIRDGRLYTGDLGYMDDEGYIFIVDRSKDLIIHHGMNIYPREIEEALYRHPAVRQAAVIGVKDGSDEYPKAFVSLHEGQKATERELRAFLKDRLAAYKLPRQMVIMGELPVSATGKVLKRELRR